MLRWETALGYGVCGLWRREGRFLGEIGNGKGNQDSKRGVWKKERKTFEGRGIFHFLRQVRNCFFGGRRTLMPDRKGKPTYVFGALRWRRDERAAMTSAMMVDGGGVRRHGGGRPAARLWRSDWWGRLPMWKDDDPGVEWWHGLEVAEVVVVAMDEEKK